MKGAQLWLFHERRGPSPSTGGLCGLGRSLSISGQTLDRYPQPIQRGSHGRAPRPGSLGTYPPYGSGICGLIKCFPSQAGQEREGQPLFSAYPRGRGSNGTAATISHKEPHGLPPQQPQDPLSA